MSTFLTTIGGLVIIAVNLNEVCKARAAGLSITFIMFSVVSIEQVYKEAFSWLILGALVLAIEPQVPDHKNVFLDDIRNFKTKF